MSVASPEMKRLEARIPARIKEQLEQAASLAGRSQTDIIIEAIGGKAQQIIREHEAIVLGRKDQIKLAKALLNPPKATANQKRRAKWYLEESGS